MSFDPRFIEPHTLAEIWNAAGGGEIAVTTRLVEYNTRPPEGTAQAGWLVSRGAGQPLGFALASVYRGDPVVSPRELGWIDALAVLPDSQGQGIGSALLQGAEQWLAQAGCTMVCLGGGLRHFAPGLPVELRHEEFFFKRGYTERTENGRVWDVACDLAHAPRQVAPPRAVEIRAAEPGDEPALRAFFEREFPGRWRYEFEQYRRDGGAIGDYTILIGASGIEAFCQLTFDRSLRPLDGFYMRRLPGPWGQAGPLGVSANRRGQGYGAAIVGGALERLRRAGVRGCLIDWTNLLTFYARFGFEPYREYRILMKQEPGTSGE